jgi:hypothetical protein
VGSAATASQAGGYASLEKQRRLNVSGMTDTRLGNLSRPTRILAALRELIDALDRRASQSERPGELQIARDAQRLRREAMAQIEELTGVGSHANTYDRGLVEAIMTDDGGPAAGA